MGEFDKSEIGNPIVRKHANNAWRDYRALKCDRTTVCVLDRGHVGPCQRPGGVQVITTADAR